MVCFLLRFNELCKRIEDPSLVLLTHYYLSFVLANKMRRNYGGEDRQTHNQPYGDLVPFGDPNWYRGYASPFYKKTHSDFRLKCRSFVEKEILPFVHEWDESKTIPKEIYIKTYEAGILPGVVGKPWREELTDGIQPPPDFDYFHELILFDEFARCGSGGVLWGLLEGVHIGLPPVLNFGSEELRRRVGRPVLQGKSIICLCITEPYAGSDVANIRCEAKKDPTGRFYIVTGEKKWITNGIWADYFTVAVRTGGKGSSGISLLVIEKSMKGVECKRMDCMGVWASGTTFITFDEVRVPVENLIGNENEGFKYIMHNFNHERWGFVVQANRFARVCYEEAFTYAHRRRTFGQRLIDHAVIRHKLAEMIRQIEATHNLLENITYQMNTLSEEQKPKMLAGITALAKVQATKVFEFCAREAAQIFGGASYVRGGQGEKVERLYRDVRAYAIPGGSEEIMLDFGVRDSMKQFSRL